MLGRIVAIGALSALLGCQTIPSTESPEIQLAEHTARVSAELGAILDDSSLTEHQKLQSGIEVARQAAPIAEALQASISPPPPVAPAPPLPGWKKVQIRFRDSNVPPGKMFIKLYGKTQVFEWEISVVVMDIMIDETTKPKSILGILDMKEEWGCIDSRAEFIADPSSPRYGPNRTTSLSSNRFTYGECIDPPPPMVQVPEPEGAWNLLGLLICIITLVFMSVWGRRR